MQRRSFLKGLAASLLQPVLWKGLLVQAATRRVITRRVRPVDAAWPSAASWEKLKNDVGGNLIRVHSLFGACESEPSGVACLEAIKNIDAPYYMSA